MSQSSELALFVFVDALGWEIFSRNEFMGDCWQVARPQETILGYSCTCDPTILTGKMPTDHGHFSFFYYDPANSPFAPLSGLRWLPSLLVDRGRVRRVLSRAVARWYGFDGYFQLYETPFEYLPYFNYSEQRDIYQPGGIVGGQATIFDVLRQRQIPFSLSDWRVSEAENLGKLKADIQRSEVPFAYLYLAGLDGILHADGTDSVRGRAHLGWYEQQLRGVLDLAEGHYDAVRLYLFSDHGMTNVTRELDLFSWLRSQTQLQFGRDYVVYLDSTMARFWFQTPAAEREINDRLSQVDGGHVLSEGELTRYGVQFEDRRYGETIFLCDPGVLICPSFMGKKPMKGMHGYAPEHQDSRALFAATNTAGPIPKRLDDMYGLMCHEIERLVPAQGANA